MKISEMIEELQKHQTAHGDLTVMLTWESTVHAVTSECFTVALPYKPETLRPFLPYGCKPDEKLLFIDAERG